MQDAPAGWLLTYRRKTKWDYVIGVRYFHPVPLRAYSLNWTKNTQLIIVEIADSISARPTISHLTDKIFNISSNI